jgi:prevent-host-death family protein
MQTSFGAFEAKTHFSQLLERATQGEEILITRRGKAVAKIVPVGPTEDLEGAKAAAHRLRSLAQEMKLNQTFWNDWKKYRDTGRR